MREMHFQVIFQFSANQPPFGFDDTGEEQLSKKAKKNTGSEQRNCSYSSFIRSGRHLDIKRNISEGFS